MKRITSLALCLGLLVCLIGCGSELPSPTQIPTAVATTPPTESVPSTVPVEPPAEYGFPLVAAATAPIEEEFVASNGTLLLRYTYQNLVLTLEDPQVADAITVDFLNLVDPTGQDTAKVWRDAKKAYEEGGSWSAYQFKRLYTPTRLDSSIFSMYGTQILSGGSAGTSAVGVSVTYDVVTGRRLSLEQVLTEDFSADDLAQAIADALSPAAQEGILFSDYAYVITELFTTNRPVENWYLSEEGLCFYFSPYEIAPYSAGTIVAQVPYSRLPGLLQDAYYPEESVELIGTVSAESFATADMSSYTQFAELILDSQGTEHLIHVSGAVGDFRLELGTWQPDGSFLPECGLFAAATLCTGDALVIQLRDGMISSIRVTYRSGNSTVSIPLDTLLQNY